MTITKKFAEKVVKTINENRSDRQGSQFVGTFSQDKQKYSIYEDRPSHYRIFRLSSFDSSPLTIVAEYVDGNCVIAV